MGHFGQKVFCAPAEILQFSPLTLYEVMGKPGLPTRTI